MVTVVSGDGTVLQDPTEPTVIRFVSGTMPIVTIYDMVVDT